ncbi:hypothetical protein [Marinactinospora rubrisoli]|uniref:DUF3307 domain-containing protein n=1 Tax=Marinactinospora rubrisoli TaxID=2715399 RepID=A0ABW2KPP3_9ACTN
MMHADPTLVPLVTLALWGGHHVGDYWLQSDHQAVTKGECSHQGRVACARHVASLTVAQALMLAAVAVATGTDVALIPAALGLGVNAVSHYWADRRATLRGLVLATERWTAKLGFYDRFGGSAHMDQAWHTAWMIPSALIMAAPLPAALLGAGVAAVLLAVANAASRAARRRERERVNAS